MDDTLLYQIALTLIPRIGPVQAKILVDHFGNAASVFKARKEELDKLDGIGEVRASSIRHFKNFKKAEEEILFIERYKIQPLFLTDDCYPKRLLNCYDPPTILFYRGNANLNTSKIVAVIGTRSNTEYGKHITEKLIADLSRQEVLVVSGLAFGIDAIAHKASLKNGLSTVGVLAHGLHTIYPEQHASLAKTIVKNGGLISEFKSNIKPDKHNFPNRNRIVAGMSDAVIVVETGIKGGSMITAELANSYNKDVFAFPGRSTDMVSAGCNQLIKTNKAMLITDAQQLLEIMGWENKKTSRSKVQKELFIELSADEKIVYDILKLSSYTHIDEINMKSGISSSRVAAAILNLEIKNIIAVMPGKRYWLI